MMLETNSWESAKDMFLLSTKSVSIIEIVKRICKKQLLLTLSVRVETFYEIACLKVVFVMVECLLFVMNFLAISAKYPCLLSTESTSIVEIVERIRNK